MKRVIGIIVVLVVVGLGVYFIPKLSASSAPEKTQYKVTKVDQGTVKKTVSATGVLQPWSVVDIKSKAGGKVEKLFVDVGSVVKKGDKLAFIDPSDTKLSVDQAQADINGSNARIGQSELTFALQVKQSGLNVKTAEATLKQAEATLEAAKARRETAKFQMNAQPGLTESNISSARANFNNAEKQLAEMRDATHPQERAASQAAMDQAKANLTNGESNLNRQRSLMDKGFVSAQVVDSAIANRDVSKATYDSAKRKLDTLESEQAASDAAMVARVAQAKSQLDNASASKVDVEVRKSSYSEAVASVHQNERAVENSRLALALATDNLKNIDIRRADIAINQSSKMRANAALINAQNTLQQTTVTCDTDGVVLKKYVEQGTIISSALSFAATGNNIIQIGDVTRMYVDVAVDETDLANVDDDQKVDITMEAFPNTPIEGKVKRIDPQLLVESNVTNVHVRVELDQDSPVFRLLKPGMNATCEFVRKKKDNVVKIPTEAMRTDDKGPFVEVAIGGKQAPVDPKTPGAPDPNTLIDVKVVKKPIEIGLEGNDSVEVIKGLSPGDVIITQKIEPVKQQMGGAMGQQRMGGFGGRR